MKATQSQLEVFQSAIDHWGEMVQVGMAIEEMGELLAALNQWDRGRVGVEEVVEEVADVMVTMHQLALMVGYDRVLEAFDKKMDKLRRKLEGLPSVDEMVGILKEEKDE